MPTPQDTLPEIIRSKHDGVLFCFWLEKHPEIAYVQGWRIRRFNEAGWGGNGVSHFGEHPADVDWLWSERRALNDWIRTYMTDPDWRQRRRLGLNPINSEEAYA